MRIISLDENLVLSLDENLEKQKKKKRKKLKKLKTLFVDPRNIHENVHYFFKINFPKAMAVDEKINNNNNNNNNNNFFSNKFLFCVVEKK